MVRSHIPTSFNNMTLMHNQEAQRNRTMLTVVPTESRPTHQKQKVGYGEEDKNVSETRRKLQHMTVDEEN